MKVKKLLPNIFLFCVLTGIKQLIDPPFSKTGPTGALIHVVPKPCRPVFLLILLIIRNNQDDG
jgi:hypothetical protein